MDKEVLVTTATLPRTSAVLESAASTIDVISIAAGRSCESKNRERSSRSVDVLSCSRSSSIPFQGSPCRSKILATLVLHASTEKLMTSAHVHELVRLA